MKKNELFVPLGLSFLALLCLAAGIWYTNFGPQRIAKIQAGERLTLLVGQQMNVPFARSAETLMYAGKLPETNCGRILTHLDGVGLWVYPGQRFMIDDLVLVVESLDEESITIRRLEERYTLGGRN